MLLHKFTHNFFIAPSIVYCSAKVDLVACKHSVYSAADIATHKSTNLVQIDFAVIVRPL